MQARTFLHNVRPGLLVIPVHAQLVLLGQIIVILPTKVHAQLARHVLRVRKPQLLVLQQQIVAHVQTVTRGSTEPVLLRPPRHVLPAMLPTTESKMEQGFTLHQEGQFAQAAQLECTTVTGEIVSVPLSCSQVVGKAEKMDRT